MKKKSTSQSGFFTLRLSLFLLLLSAGVFLALLGSGLFAAAEGPQAPQENSGIQVGHSYKNDVSPALRDLAPLWPPTKSEENEEEELREANLNPKLPLPLHEDAPDPVIEHGVLGLLIPDAMPSPILNFDGIVFPGVACNCHPPDTNGAVGLTQYVQMVNEGYQVFNKTTGASVLGPLGITTIWSGFGGACQNGGFGDPVVLYDHIANRWVITQFASATGGTPITDECIAISTTADATGTYNRYGFHLGSNFFDYPHFGVWPDGYYMAMNVFNSTGTAFLGPQAFAFDRAKMLTGVPATFVTPGITGGASEPSFLPSDLDGSILPTAGVGNPFVSFPGSGTYKVRLFHADFVTPANTTFTLIGSPAAAGFTTLCPSTRACVPQLAPQASLDGIGDRLMFRLAYRKFSDGHEAVVGNYSVSAGGVAGVRWFELRAVTTAPVVFQQSTYQPDTTWRWMGSAAMDQLGDLAIGFNASSSAIHPEIRYAGRLANDPVNTLAQGETTLIAGAGSQGSGNGNRWGDYSAMTVDPVDDCTFWYTQEYYATNGGSWRTRIGSFKFPTCPAGGGTPTPTPTLTPTPSPTVPPSPSPTVPPSPSPTATLSPTPSPTATATPTPSDAPSPTPCGTNTFANPAPIIINDAGVGSPYPSTIAVSGVTGSVTKVTATITGFSHTFPSDLDVLLVGPGGQKFILVSDVIGGTDAVGINWTFDDAAAAFIGSTGTPASGTFKPTNYTTCQDPFAAPAPAGPYLSPGGIGTPCGTDTLAAFNGVNPNGTWSLYVVDDLGADVGTISGGWRLNFTTTGGCGTPTPSPTATPATPTPTPTATATPPTTPTPTSTPTPATPTPTPTTTPTPPPPTPTPTPPTPTPTPPTPTPTPPTPTPTPPTPTPTPPTPTPAPPTPTPTPTLTPTPTPTATPTPTPTVTPTPSPSPAAQTINLSTRMQVQTGANVGIGGFIITGSAPKHVLLRAIGPSLTGSGIPDSLADPILELHGPGAFVTITNDNWRDTQEAEIQATGIPPTNNLESAISATLAPGNYTAIIKGKNNTSGLALVEVYDLDQSVGKLANISTRAFVSTGANVVIAGFILGNNGGNDRIAVRGLGPSLAAAGLSNVLADPVLELRDGNGVLRVSNNDWQDNPAQAAELIAAGLAPTNSLESGIAVTLPPGAYTALLAGLNNGTGLGLVEIYDRGAAP